MTQPKTDLAYLRSEKAKAEQKFRVTPEERARIRAKMEQLGTRNMAAYLRKMAPDGYCVRLDLPELKELLSLLRRGSNNLNQIARRVNTTGRAYEADLADIRQQQEKLWEAMRELLTRLVSIS